MLKRTSMIDTAYHVVLSSICCWLVMSVDRNNDIRRNKTCMNPPVTRFTLLPPVVADTNT